MEQKLSQKLLNKKFEVLPTGFLGGKPASYSKAEVEDFIQESAVSAEKLEKVVKDLERKIEILETQKSYSYQFKGATEEELSQVEKELSLRAKNVARMEKSFTRMVVVAEEQAEGIRHDAHKEGKTIVQEHEKIASELVKEAKRMRDEAEKEAESILKEANAQRDNMEKRYEEIKLELGNIHSFIEKSVLTDENKAAFVKKEVVK